MPPTGRGCRDTAADQARLAAEGVTAAMCRTGDGFDDALAESVVGSLKTDLVEEAQWLTRRAARTAIVDGLEMFATRQHLHSAPDVRSPAAFEGTTYPLVASRHRVDETGAT